MNIELVLTRSTGCFGLLLYLLALPDVLVQIPVTTFGLDLILIASIPAAIIWSMLVQPGPWQRVSTGTAALLMILSFLLWHLGVIGTGSHAESRPWSYGISGLSIALAAVAFRATWAAVYSALFCLAILLVPITSAGNFRGWEDSSQDALLGAVTAVVIVAPITALRRAAKNSDKAALTAVREAAAAAQAKALRAERTRLDGLTHDTVMVALNVAAQAQSGEVMDAAARAAKDSIRQLDELQTGPDVEGKRTSPDELVSRIRTATAAYDTKIFCETGIPEGQLIPSTASQGLIQATAEAVRNSSIHAAGPSEVTIRFSTEDPLPSISIQVTDEGPGFDPQTVNPKRLGIRVSIVRRMKDISGEATIHSRPGAGTRIHLRWKGTKNDE